MPGVGIALLFAVTQFVAATWLINCKIMRFTGCWLKEVSMGTVLLLGSAGTFALFAFGWKTANVRGLLTLHPTTAAGAALVALFVAELLLSVWLFGRLLIRSLGERDIPQLRRFSSRLVEWNTNRTMPGFAINHNALHLTEIDLTLNSLPAAFDGLRVLHLSDLHVEWAERINRHVLEKARALEPDLVLVTGDFVVKQATPALDGICAQLRDLKAPFGTWCIRGNHDLWHDSDAVSQTLARNGLPLLSNRAHDLEFAGERLRLIGVEHPWNEVSDWEALLGEDEDVCRIVLSHTPDNFPLLARRGADLVLAGHTHGGQWRAPFVGSLIVPSNFGKRFDQGLFEDDGSLLWVTRGIGCVGLPIRVNCAPEMTLLTLRSPAAAQQEPEPMEGAA